MLSSEEIYLKQGLTTIEDLISEGKYPEAIQAGSELLEVDPKNREAQKLFEKAQKLLNREKMALIKTNFKKARALEKVQRYPEAYQISAKLNDFYPGLSRVTKLLKRLSQKILKQEKAKKKTFVKQGFLTIKKLEKEGDFEKVIKVCAELSEVVPENKKLFKIDKKARLNFIDQKLKSNLQEKLLQKKEYEKLYLFYQKLYQVFPHHRKLRHLINQCEKLVIGRRREEKKEYIEESFRRIENLYQAQEFEKAILGAEELHHFTKGNRQAKKWLKKAKKANQKEIDQEVLRKLLELPEKLKLEYQEEQIKFVRV